jgi:thiamine-monophosphate kinase
VPVPLPEKSLIKTLRRVAGGGLGPGVIRGIGDDCAVLKVGAREEILVTTDFSLENVHFRREWHPAESVGHRCLARGLSDIAAMAGEPLAAFLSLALPAELPQSWVDGFMRGFRRLAKRFKLPLAGGDIAQSPAGVLADIIVLGRVPKGQAILRSGARPGDVLYVSGSLGNSAARLEKLEREGASSHPPRFKDAYFYPEPRIKVARFLREKRLASAAIDTSDGLSTDLSHICEESKVGAVLYADAIPRSAGVTLEQALHGGEDYQLLFTTPRRLKIPARIAGVPITQIGEIEKGSRMFLEQNGTRTPLQPKGWEHFSEK